jgi:fused signal recognition particle receptor
MRDGPHLDLDDTSSRDQPAGGFWSKLKRGLSKSHGDLVERIERVVTGRALLDAEALEALEETLIGADLGVETSLELVTRLESDVRRGEIRDSWRLRERLIDEIAVLLLDAIRPASWAAAPAVTLVVGVNGAGKTTSIAKLARRYTELGSRVLLVAADTFRAAAIEQLELWSSRIGVEIIKGRAGADPGAVVFDGLQAARARRADHVLVDTAGRLHTKDHLMSELAKMRRIVDREGEGFALRSLLVLDATTGHNALQQARLFKDAAAVDGVLLAKLDGTARGGMAVAIARELRLPVLYLGVGETADDLVEFRPREFATALLGAR